MNGVPGEIETFIHSAYCQARVFCKECRTSSAFRESLFRQGAVTQANFECPYGFSSEYLPTPPPASAILHTINGKPVYDLPKLWGPRKWARLHLRALKHEGKNDEKWLEEFREQIPCKECRKHWDAFSAQNPPNWKHYFEWTVECHNKVNALLGKPLISSERAREIWLCPKKAEAFE